MTEAERLLVVENGRLRVLRDLDAQVIDALERENERLRDALAAASPDAGAAKAPEPRRWLKRRTR